MASQYTSRSQGFYNPTSLKRQRESNGHHMAKVIACVDPRLRSRLVFERVWCIYQMRSTSWRLLRSESLWTQPRLFAPGRPACSPIKIQISGAKPRLRANPMRYPWQRGYSSLTDFARESSGLRLGVLHRAWTLYSTGSSGSDAGPSGVGPCPWVSVTSGSSLDGVGSG